MCQHALHRKRVDEKSFANDFVMRIWDPLDQRLTNWVDVGWLEFLVHLSLLKTSSDAYITVDDVRCIVEDVRLVL